ncbi:protein of unknown function [Atopomonas hussainii]|uniref:Uncharacterized protein n=1 Tax=Atopomonas hussainii TaxID=1429083 RepID=A0A1H7GHP8_9GAMM|nr:DUF5064 family protein [Atopomonas hussainii]SEK36000.1 protein of unknown function [Atopomonas hussainii]
MFRPGHLHRSLIAEGDRPALALTFEYTLGHDERQGEGVDFVLFGTLGTQTLNERFFLPRDSAFNFAHEVNLILTKHGLPSRGGPVMFFHDEYDQVFADVRRLVHGEAGEAVDLREFE